MGHEQLRRNTHARGWIPLRPTPGPPHRRPVAPSSRAMGTGTRQGYAREGWLFLMPNTNLRSYVTLPDDLGAPAVGPIADRPARILLTGATGYLGAYLVAALL